MTYTEKGDEVILQMSRPEFDTLLVAAGYMLGDAKSRGDVGRVYRWTAFINRMNAGNPRFTPYEVPAEFAAQRTPS